MHPVIWLLAFLTAVIYLLASWTHLQINLLFTVFDLLTLFFPTLSALWGFAFRVGLFSELAAQVEVIQVAALAIVVTEPKNHGWVWLQSIEEICVAWEYLFDQLILPQHLFERNLNLCVLRQTLMINTMAHNQKPERMHYKPNEMPEVPLFFGFCLLELKNVWSDSEHQLQELLDDLWLNNFLNEAVLIIAQDNDVDDSLCQER